MADPSTAVDSTRIVTYDDGYVGSPPLYMENPRPVLEEIKRDLMRKQKTPGERGGPIQMWRDYRRGRQMRKGDEIWRPSGDKDGYCWRSETGFMDNTSRYPNWRAKWVVEVKDASRVPTCEIWGPNGRREPNFDVWHWISDWPEDIHMEHWKELHRRKLVRNPYW